jgi:ferritin
MLNKKIENAINKQINAEIYSAYLYYSMGAYFDSLSLKGFSHWMRVQTLEELYHAQKFVGYLNDRGAKAVMKPMEGPETSWKSPLEVFKFVYEHEQKVTSLINALMDLALKESDHATVSFLQWYVNEQVEEESSADEVIHKLKLIDKTEGGLFLLDQELDKRTFVLPPELAGKF